MVKRNESDVGSDPCPSVATKETPLPLFPHLSNAVSMP